MLGKAFGVIRTLGTITTTTGVGGYRRSTVSCRTTAAVVLGVTGAAAVVGTSGVVTALFLLLSPLLYNTTVLLDF